MHYGVFIGRFQPYHRGHHHIVTEALKQVDRLIILVGSASNPCSPKNPLTYDECVTIIESAFSLKDLERIRILPIEDYPYNDHRWIAGVQEAIQKAIEINFRDYQYEGSKISLVGHAKDHSSYYLKMFPNFGSIDVPNCDMLNATDIRDHLFQKFDTEDDPEWLKYFVDDHHGSMTFTILEDAQYRIKDEIQYIIDYKRSWGNTPYPPAFITADAVVVCAGHILLVERGQVPGKGLWALPGGHVNADSETFIDAAIRELKEETKLKVPAPVLRGSIKKIRTADYPYRSERGRYVSQVFYMEIGFNINDPIELPKVHGSDDAKVAKWIKLSDFVRMRNVMFEDHYSIVTDLLGII